MKAKAKSHRFRRHDGKGERRRQVVEETMSTGRRELCQVRQTFSLDHGKGQGRFAIITHATATSYIAPRHTSYTWLQQKSTCISPDILPRKAYMRICNHGPTPPGLFLKSVAFKSAGAWVRFSGILSPHFFLFRGKTLAL